MRRIGIAGAGGIGGNVAVHLVRSGVKYLRVVDFDVIDQSNLNRQFYFADQIGMPKVEALKVNLLRINPAIDLEVIQRRVTSDNIVETFAGCDLLVEGFDRAENKAMFLEGLSGTGRSIFSSSGIAGMELDTITTRKFGTQTWIVGDFTTDIALKKVYAPKVFVVASIMANLVLKELGYGDVLE